MKQIVLRRRSLSRNNIAPKKQRRPIHVKTWKTFRSKTSGQPHSTTNKTSRERDSENNDGMVREFFIEDYGLISE